MIWNMTNSSDLGRRKVQNAVFIYDGPIQKDSAGNYYSTVINNTVFNRYLGHAEHLTVAIRTQRFADDHEAGRSKKIDLSHVDVLDVPTLSSAFGMILNRKKVHDILKAEIKKADLIIIRLPSFIGAEAVRVAKKQGRAYLVEVVGCPWDSLWNYGVKGKCIAPFMTLSMKDQVKQAPYVIYVTNRFLQSRYPTNGMSANCSNVEIPAVDESVLDNRLAHIERHAGKIILGTTAAVNVPYKGHQYVIEAIAELKRRGITNYQYQMVGDGNRKRLEKLIADLDLYEQIQFMGVMTHEQVFEWLDSIDIYIQPSRQEGLPRALIEAMSRGLPCIGARTGGIPELLPMNRIFSNTSSNIQEICDLLLSMDKEQMKADALRNHCESKTYEIGKIKLRRDHLLDLLMTQGNT